MAEKQGETLLVDHVLSVLRKTFPDSWWHKNVVAMVQLRSGQPSLVGLGKGSPDIVGCVRHPDGHGLFVGFEAKTPRGEQSTDQKSFESRLGRAGGYYKVIRSANDAVQAVKELLDGKG
jgi:hypothetical protein